MNLKPTLAFFATRSSDGIELQNEFLTLAEKLGFNAKLFKNSTELEYAQICAKFD